MLLQMFFLLPTKKRNKDEKIHKRSTWFICNGINPDCRRSECTKTKRDHHLCRRSWLWRCQLQWRCNNKNSQPGKSRKTGPEIYECPLYVGFEHPFALFAFNR